MNIFLIPSWYPHPTSPIVGCFIKEQGYYYAELCLNDRVIVSLTDTSDFKLPLLKPQTWIPSINRYFKALRFRELVTNNFYEWYRPVLQWSDLLGGNLKGIIAVHWKNFLEAQKRFGSIDIIHAHVTYPAGWVAMKLSLQSGVPYAITEHMSPFPFSSTIPRLIRNGKLTNWITEPLKLTHGIVAVSPSLANCIASFGFRHPQVIPNVVDERKFVLQTNIRTNQTFTFLTVSGMVEQKGIADLLKAIALVIHEIGNVRFCFAGDGPLAKAYRCLAHNLGIDHAVRWLGSISRKDMPNLFQQCDAFVLTSHHETFGVVYAEAIACGKPIIATRCGGPESIVNIENGLLVNVGDIDGIRDALLEMIKNYDQYCPDKIRADFMNRFSRPAVIKKLNKFYRSLVASNRLKD